MGREYRAILAYVLLFTLISVAAIGDPNTPTSITQGANSRSTGSGNGLQLGAQAGNVTELAIIGTATTQAWQGYYGNITGEIVLDNANNQSFYEWDIASPQGEIYAANQSTITWSNVTCVNLTGNGTTQGLNASLLNAAFGIDSTDADTFQRTFNETFTGSFLIGTKSFGASSACPMTQIYNGSATHSTDWQEVLLTDNATKLVMFASILRDNRNAFDNSSRDFQMLVADNGHNGDTTPTNYFFFVELE